MSNSYRHFSDSDIDTTTENNDLYRKVISDPDALDFQVTVQCLVDETEDVPLEMHRNSSQAFKFITGYGEVLVYKNRKKPPVRISVKPESLVIVGSGTWHYVRNTGSKPLRFYAIYSAPVHDPKVIETRQNRVLKLSGKRFLFRDKEISSKWFFLDEKGEKLCDHRLDSCEGVFPEGDCPMCEK